MGDTKLKVLLLADDCNPEWPSLPVVGYKYALALGAICDVTVATHVRNKENIEKQHNGGTTFVFLDNEYVAAPMFSISKFLRGGTEVAWSTSQIFSYLPYLAFERAVFNKFSSDIENGHFDIIHRITPMSPTLPSYLAGKSSTPFVIGPLNGNLPWPNEFSAERKRERERLRALRYMYKRLPYSKSTYKNASGVLVAFEHTREDIKLVDPNKIVMFPEIGFDPIMFFSDIEERLSRSDGKVRFLFVGRLVPYKLPEVVVRAFGESALLRKHALHVVGSGPEAGRLQEIIERENLQDCVFLEGQKTQSEVAGLMRQHDVFVFPSIRELGAGVVVEAMASGMACIVVNYGAPGSLAGDGRGIAVELAPLDAMVESFRQEMERLLLQPAHRSEMMERAKAYAARSFPWSAKASKTVDVYRAILRGEPLAGHGYS